MNTLKISSGTVHGVTKELREIIASSPSILSVWEDITPLARNEWLCWITSAKEDETRERRIRIMLDKFKKGERRPCCWAGCIHS